MLTLMFLILAVITVWGIKTRKTADGDALCPEQTGVIRGFFAVIILMSHMRQYVTFNYPTDNYSMSLMVFIGQLMVTVFLFYSGYGIALSYDRKDSYDKSFFKKRIIKTWLHFAVAVLIYFILGICLKSDFSVKQIILSFVGWDSLGNSNWYVFDTLVLYLISLFAFIATKFILGRKSVKGAAVIVTALSFAFLVFLSITRDTWWYDTLMTFSFGWWFYIFKASFFNAVSKNKVYYPILIITAAAFFIISRLQLNPYIYNVFSCIFVLLITLVTFKLKIGNSILKWLGKNSFYIYIYMRVPMILLTHFKLSDNLIIFCAVSVISTFALSFIFQKLEKPLDKIILKL